MHPRVLLVLVTRRDHCASILAGIAKFTESHEPWTIFLDDEGRATNETDWLRKCKWDGIISRHATQEFADICADLRIPLVDLNDTYPISGTSKIRPDNRAVGQIGAEHLLERGFTNFAFCGFRGVEWSRDRRAGFCEAIELAGFGAKVYESHYPADFNPIWSDAEIDSIAKWIHGLPKPLAVMSCDDYRGIQVIEAGDRLKALIPEQLAVLGVNNDEFRCEFSHPPLSSVPNNTFLMGHLAAETLANRMAGNETKDHDVRIEPLDVVTRPSTDVLAIDDKNLVAALQYIRENACKGISVNQIEKHAAASRSVLEKKFRKFLRRSPHAEIRRVQIAHVRQLLIDTDYPLKRIAELTGFEHVEYLSVVFKRLSGESPGRFRKRVQAAADR